jgi:predicted PurR-regulated permease PerM
MTKHDDGSGVGGSEALVPPSPDRPSLLIRVGFASWSVVGLVAVLAICLLILSALSEVAIPVLLGAFVAVVVKPAADSLRRRGMHPTGATGVVLGGLLAVIIAVVASVIHGLVSQSDQITSSMDDALATASNELGVDPSSLASAREAVADLGPVVGAGTLTSVVSGVSAVAGFVSGLLLALIVMYYLVKDGASLRKSYVGIAKPELREELDDFIGESCRTLRGYAHGRTVLSAIVTAVMGITSAVLGIPLVMAIMAVTFIGGYIPYIGAFVAGAFTVLLALGNGGVGPAVVILLVSLISNLALENFVEPRVMGKSLDIHPLLVLVVTALGGLVGGIVGLIVAVPLAIITGSAISRLRASGHLERAAAKARPAAEKLLAGTSDAPSPPGPPG